MGAGLILIRIRIASPLDLRLSVRPTGLVLTFVSVNALSHQPGSILTAGNGINPAKINALTTSLQWNAYSSFH